MRRLWTVVVVSLLLAGCAAPRTSSGAGTSVGVGDATSSTAAGSGRPSAGEGSGTGAPSTPTKPGSATGPVPTTTTAPGGSAGRPTGAADLPGGSDPATTVAARADDGSQGPPGAFARTLLRPTASRSIVLERLVQPGAGPSATTTTFLADTVRRVAAKDVSTPVAAGLGAGAKDWSADDIRALADREAKVAQGAGGQAVVRLLFLRGSFEGDTSILGVTVRGDVVAVFSDAIDSATTPVITGDDLEEAVVVHELGHVLGLVDLVLSTGRADPDHPGHSKNTRSVMYWAVESSLVSQVLTGPPPRTFDDADQADLAAIRSGA